MFPQDVLAEFIKAVITLFIIVDPLGNIPIFIGLTENLSKEERRRVFRVAVVVASALLALWSFYNLKRYGDLHRRTGILVTDPEALKKTFSLSDAQLHFMQQAKHASVAFAPDGRIADVSA